MVDWNAAPESGRRDTLLAALKRLHELAPGGTIVEIGTSRNPSPAGMLGDGWGTRMFGWYAAQTAGRVVSIDPNRRAIDSARKICAEYLDVIELRRASAADVVREVDDIALLYMDGPSRTKVHMDTYRALVCKPPLILIDDVQSWPPGDDWTGEAPLTLMITTLLADGYAEVFTRDRQMLLELA